MRGRGEAAGWRGWQRVAFRFVFAYFAQFLLFSGHKTLLGKLPLLGRTLEQGLERPYVLAASWIAKHVLGLHGAAAVPHPSGFADRALDWIAFWLMVTLAAAATLLWSALSRRREYEELALWLRFGLRLTVAVAMLWYGSIKLWPVQIEPASLAVLNEPVGNMSPLTLLWTTLGLNPWFERMCGAAETMAALLLLYRRTALVGAVLAAFIMANVVAFDLAFDVPVKLYATNLLAMTVVMMVPDARMLWRLFWQHRAGVIASRWAPTLGGRGRWLVWGLEAMLVLVFLRGFVNHGQYTREHAAELRPSALAGQWHLLSATMADGSASAFATGDGVPMVDLFLEPSGRDTVRAADDTLWGGGTYDEREVTLITRLRALATFRIGQQQGELVLTPQDPGYPVLRFSRVRLPGSYRLYRRGFHWVNEWGFEQ